MCHVYGTFWPSLALDWLCLASRLYLHVGITISWPILASRMLGNMPGGMGTPGRGGPTGLHDEMLRQIR